MSQPVSTPAATQPLPAIAETRLHGRRLILARAGWLVLVIPSIALFISSLIVSSQPLPSGAIPAQAQQMFSSVGLSVSGFNTLNTLFNVLTSAIWYGVGFFLFWRRSDDWLALLAALVLVLFNVGPFSNNNAPSVLALAYPALTLPLSLVSFLAYSSLGVFLLLFPSGRLAPRWMGLIVLLFLIQSFLGNFPSPSSPFDANWPGWVQLPGTLVLYGALIYSQIYRYRRVSTPTQRQQTKWVVFGVAVAITVIIVLLTITPLSTSPFVEFLVTFILWPATLLLIPLSIGFSILRYRIYDIDLLINRALVYGSLTALLGALYAGLIIGLESLAGLVGGTAAQNPLVLVISTLAIAALFQPARRRLQAFIDRRFYRQKYDAEKALAAFSATLRQEVDLEELRARLLAVVQETIQPAHVSLWLRQPERHLTEQTHRLEPRGTSADKNDEC